MEKILLSTLLGAGLIGCSSLSRPPTVSPTEPPLSPTALPATALPTAGQATVTPAPFNLATPALVIEQSSSAELASATSSGVLLPPAQITVFRPGPASQVVSPFQVFGRGGPSYNERVTLRLFGEDGRLISEKVTYLLVYPGRAGNFVAQMEFTTPFVAEAARLEVSTQDPRYGRLSQLASVELVLLAAGLPRVHPQLDGPEKLAILAPREGTTVQGGVLPVRGAGWAASAQPLTLELLDRNGDSLAQSTVWLDAPAVGQAGSFTAELRYQLPFPQYGRLVLYEQREGIPGLLHYSSVEVWLLP